MPDYRTLIALAHMAGVSLNTARSYFDRSRDPRLSTANAIEVALLELGLGHLRRDRAAA